MKAQKHVTVALARLLRLHGAAILNAMMGWGVRPVSCWYEGLPQTVTAVYL
jgi:hypothetical protein